MSAVDYLSLEDKLCPKHDDRASCVAGWACCGNAEKGHHRSFIFIPGRLYICEPLNPRRSRKRGEMCASIGLPIPDPGNSPSEQFGKDHYVRVRWEKTRRIGHEAPGNLRLLSECLKCLEDYA